MIQPLIRAAGPQKRGLGPPSWAEGPQKPFARARIVAQKEPCFLVMKKVALYNTCFVAL